MVKSRYIRNKPLSLRMVTNGINIHYLDWGEGASSHLILIHGLGSQSHTWDRFAGDVSDLFRVIAPDLRGHGKSGHAEDGYKLESFAKDLKALTRHLNLSGFDLVGHSLGALIAIRFAWEYPDLVNRLVLVDAGPGLDTQTAKFGGAADSFVRPAGFHTDIEAKSWYRARHPNDTEEKLSQRVEYGMKKNWADRWVFRHDPDLYWILEGGDHRSNEYELLWEMLATIPCPILVVRGEQSPLLLSDAAKQVADGAENGALIEIAGAGHSVHSDAPDLFREAVVKFLG